MGRKSRHHTVPIVYLKHFAFEKKSELHLWAYDKFNGKIFECNVKDATVEKDFYTLEASDEQQVWEDYYAQIVEPQIERYIGKLVKKASAPLINNGVELLDNKLKSKIALLMAFQIYRGRVARQFLEQIADVVIPEVLETAVEKFANTGNEAYNQWVREYRPDDDLIKYSIAEASINIESIKRVAKVLMSRCWVIYKICGDDEFVTSDNPVMLVDASTNNPDPFSSGLIYQSTYILFPISSKLLIAIYPRTYYMGFINDIDKKLYCLEAESNKAFISNANRNQKRQCYRQTFAKTKDAIKMIT